MGLSSRSLTVLLSGVLVCSLTQSAYAAQTSQWAVKAVATSEYDQYWGASNATGAPDAQLCDVSGVVWSSENVGETAQLVTSYATAVYPRQINVYQNNTRGAVSKIEVSADGVIWTSVYQGNPTAAVPGTCDAETTVDDVLSVSTRAISIKINRVRVTVSQVLKRWAYIDAVELVGTPAKVAQTIAAVPTTVKMGGVIKLPLVSSAGLPVVWISRTIQTCLVSGGTLRPRKAGVCTVFGSNGGSADYLPTSKQVSLTVR